MPASTLDPVNAALRTSLSKSTYTNNLDSQLAGSTKKALLSNIEFEAAGCYQSSVLDKLKSKYIVLEATEPLNNGEQKVNKTNETNAEETVNLAKHELFPLKSVQLGWNNNSDWSVGAGMVNMGNTCYLNSTLQALFHVPALVNWLVSEKQHMAVCGNLGGSLCVICAMRKTLLDSQQRNVNSIRPYLIYNKLRMLCKNLLPGRQEDAHEFLRYLVEAMEKNYLKRFKNYTEFDSRTKETTPLNQILGGYLRSTVRCLKCGHISTTFQHFQDLLLDIRKAQTLTEALDLYFSREKLDDDSYHCESCQKKVPASKQFSLERAPMVICIQLKRFSITNNKITKHMQFRQRLDLAKYMRKRPVHPLVYRLVALVTHVGATVNCGHYTAIAQAPCGNFYLFDDNMVKPISHQAVFGTTAYIMLYELESSPFHSTTNGKLKTAMPISTITKPPLEKQNCTNQVNGNTKVYGPVLPPTTTNGENAVSPVQNGDLSCTNGNNDISETSPSSSSSESDPEQSVSSQNGQKENTPSSSTPPPPTTSACSNSKPESKLVKSPLKARVTNSQTNGALIPKRELFSSQVSSTSNSEAHKTSESTNNTSNSVVHVRTKLVPYETDDSSSCSEGSPNNGGVDTPSVSTKASVGDWNVSSSTDGIPEPSTEGNTWEKNKSNTVNELLKLSHDGYAAPVASWNGNRSQSDKDVNERREDRKRPFSDTSNQGRVTNKHPKISTNGSHNPGYNPIQEYHNSKNWNQTSNSHYRHFYNTNRHRNDRRLYQKNNYHKNYRFRP